MIYLNAFLFCGIVCVIGQIILDNTKLTPGHVNTLLVIVGCILSGFGIYEKFIIWAGAGATVPISNFGHLVVQSAYKGYSSNNITGLLQGLFSGASGGISATIIISFLVTLFFKPKH